jgi:hypothetical protein
MAFQKVTYANRYTAYKAVVVVNALIPATRRWRQKDLGSAVSPT